ncbi:MAG TPA: N-acetylmuramoyl-L-alanine amidase, partial [Deferrisomatales bacterium]|nr:N-acetylmuramoyl-L-alanine amidase [Deferrisomatales bacterium]
KATAGGPVLAVDRRYRVENTRGLDRRPTADEFPAALRSQLQRRGVWQDQFEPRRVDLVVVHTTEHRGAPLDNVARYMNRNRLANYLIGRDGAVYEIVPEAYRAFGCGDSLWEGRYEVDHEAINVELLADTAPGEHQGDILAAQYAGLSRLLDDLSARHPLLHSGRVVTHRMVAFSYAYGTRSRKGDPYTFDWAAAGLPDNSVVIDQDVLLGRAKLCTDQRYSDRVTEGQTAAARFQNAL